MDEIGCLSNVWLRQHAAGGEKRFSVAAFQRDYVLSQPVALVRQNGEAVAFATVMTTDLREEVTVGLMRHKPGPASRYAMEYLFVRLIQYFREHGYRSFSLGTVPLSGFRAHRLAPRWHRLGSRHLVVRRPIATIFKGCAPSRENSIRSGSRAIIAASGWFGPYLALIDIAALIGGGVRASVGRRRTAERRGRIGAAAAGVLAIVATATLFASSDRRGRLKPAISARCMRSIPLAQMRDLVVLFSDCPRLDFGNRMIPQQCSRATAFSRGR